MKVLFQDLQAQADAIDEAIQHKSAIRPTHQIIDLGTMHAGASRPLAGIEYFPAFAPRSLRRNFGLSWSATNGTWQEAVAFALVDGQWLQAMRTYKGERLIRESVDADFPRRPDGEVAWTHDDGSVPDLPGV